MHMLKEVLVLPLLFAFTDKSLCFNVPKPVQNDYPGTSNVLNNLIKPSSDYTQTSRENKFSFSVPGLNERKFELNNVGDLLKSLKLPGYNVYRLDFNDINDKQRKQVNYKNNKRIYFNEYPITETIHSDKDNKYSFSPELTYEKNTSDVSLTTSNLVQVSSAESSTDKNSIKTDHDDQDSRNLYKFTEDTTTIVESTTSADYLNSTEEIAYGGLSDRANIPPELLASLVG